MTDYAKPLPIPDADTLPFWEGCKAHELRVQRCTRCRGFRWPPRQLCPHCHSWDSEWLRVAGTGVIESYVVVHHVYDPSFADDTPYVLAHITLDGTNDQIEMLSTVVDWPWEDVKVGMPVEVVFDDVTPQVTLPRFRVRSSAPRV